MSWSRYDDSGTRWTWDGDEERHVLVLHDGELREYHEVPAPGAPTVHVYDVVSADRWDEREPLNEAEHQATYAVADEHAPWVRALDDRELFDWLEGGKYADATGGGA